MATADDFATSMSSPCTSADPPVLEALNFPMESPSRKEHSGQNSPFTCVCCDSIFDENDATDVFLKHLALSHKLVIGDVKKIANLNRYLEYWKTRFKDNPLEQFCTVIKTNSKSTDPEPADNYYLLCDVLPEDKTLRTRLQDEKLSEVLAQQQYERDSTSFNRGCLFCRETFVGNRAALFDHMIKEHSFNVGLPDNLVYTDKFLDVLESKLQSLQCFYCEKTFKDRHVLKEHMRKKQHKKINSSNTLYDQFYIINYLESGKNWESIHSEDDNFEEEAKEGDWNDWEETEEEQTVCLFCDYGTRSPSPLMHHMKDVHRFDLDNLRRNMNLTFYQQVKLVNYIRRQVHLKHCISCEEFFESNEALLNHMESNNHIARVPPQTVWNQPQYYFPTYENDNLLCALQDDDESSEEEIQQAEANVTGSRRRTVSSEVDLVIAEDLPFKDSVLKDSELLEDLRA